MTSGQRPPIERVPWALLLLLVRKLSVRHWWAAPRLSALLVVILALGIGVYFSMRLANRAAIASFEHFTQLIAAESDWLITAPGGTLPQSVLREIRQGLGELSVTIFPIVETTAVEAFETAAGELAKEEELGTRSTFTLVGVDLVAVGNAVAGGKAEGTSAPVQQIEAGDAGFLAALGTPRGVFVTDAFAKKRHLRTGAEIRMIIQDQIVNLQVVGTLPTAPGRPEPPETMLVMDLPRLQALAQRPEKLDRIEFVVEPGNGIGERKMEVKRKLEQLSRGRWTVESPNDRKEAGAMMTRAFRLNLTLLSLIALLVGLYLIFQALDGAVIRRRDEIGILRSLGVEERTIQAVWLLEAALIGVVGGGFGLLLGWGGAQFSVRLVGRTVNALYYSTSAQSAALSGGEIVGAMFLALGTSLLAGWWPARVAARTPPAQILVRHLAPAGSRNRGSWAWVGIALLAISVVGAMAAPWRIAGGIRIPIAGYGSAFGSIFGTGLLAAPLLKLLAWCLSWFGNRSAPLRLALSQLRRPSGRHQLAAAGLVCAIAMTAGMAILVASFDRTMRGWIDRTFLADLYIASDGAQSAGTQNRILPSTWRRVVSDPSVLDANVIQMVEINLRDGKVMLVGSRLDFIQTHGSLAWLDRPSDDFFHTDRNSGMAVVSETFTERFRSKVGDSLQIPTPGGVRRLVITGTFVDYGNERGSIGIDRNHFTEWFGDELATSLILVTKPGVDAEALRVRFLKTFPGLRIFTNAHLRVELIRIFRQTFSITYALELIGVVVAVLGLALTLTSVLLERRGELTTLRALGFAHGEIAMATAWEGVILAFAGVIAGSILSVWVGWLLVFVINKQTFGWTLQFAVPWAQMGGLTVIVVLSGAVVAYYVGRWGAALPADREE